MSLVTLVLTVACAPAPAPAPTLAQVLDALQVVETGGERDGGRDALGDGGRSLGPLQISRAYWLDAGQPGRYEDCRDASYARTVAIAYWERWCPEALMPIDAETLARVHNGGPRGMQKPATRAFWRKVSAVLAGERRRVAGPAVVVVPIAGDGSR
jgi:hypothetical protein